MSNLKVKMRYMQLSRILTRVVPRVYSVALWVFAFFFFFR